MTLGLGGEALVEVLVIFVVLVGAKNVLLVLVVVNVWLTALVVLLLAAVAVAGVVLHSFDTNAWWRDLHVRDADTLALRKEQRKKEKKR